MRIRAAADIGAEARVVKGAVRAQRDAPGLAAVGVAVSSSVTVCAPAPLKRTFGVAVPVSRRVTPVLAAPDFFARLQSPATSARPSITVNSTFSPSPMAVADPTLARLTTVGSSSLIV